LSVKRQRSKLKMTASALKSVPSWNLTPSRSVQVHSVLSSLAVHSVARAGIGVVEPGSYGLVLVERLQALAGHAERFAVGDDGGVQLDRVSATAKDERDRFRGRRFGWCWRFGRRRFFRRCRFFRRRFGRRRGARCYQANDQDQCQYGTQNTQGFHLLFPPLEWLRKLRLVWGVKSIVFRDITSFS
jgi:hypothetical protein